MTDLSKRLEQTIKSAIQNGAILPVKTAEGILVGDVLIVSEGTYKHIYRKDNRLYADIGLNARAIAIANILARKKSVALADNIYRADQVHSRWFTESQMLRAQYQKAITNKNFERADMLWARYQESRLRTDEARNNAQSLAAI